jgi:hypothetical protein
MQGVTAASYNEYDIWVSPKSGIFMVETIGVSQFACQQFTEGGILGELITTPLSENSISGASGQGTSMWFFNDHGRA